MEKIGETICLFGIVIFQLILCSADDGLAEPELKKIYKISAAKGDTIDGINYKIIKGEIIKEPSKRIWMKVENPKTVAESKSKTPENKGSKMPTEAKPKESYVSHEIEVFTSLKKGKKDLLGECVVDMLDHGTYDKKKVMIISGLGKNLKEYSPKAYSWDKLSKLGPCMVKALGLLHNRNYVHRNLKPEIFAFGTEEKVGPLKNQAYLFDVGLAEKYRHSNGSHKSSKKVKEFFGEMAFASRAAMDNMTQSRSDDMESLFFVLAHLAGFTSVFETKEFKELYDGKNKFCTDTSFEELKTVYEKSNLTDVRILNALMDFADDLHNLFESTDNTEEPEYNDFKSCFDQGLSQKEIDAKYKFESLKDFKQMSTSTLLGQGLDRTNKKEVVMKLFNVDVELRRNIDYKDEVRIYKDLKKGTKQSLLTENICDMLDYGVYDDRRAIIMPRLGVDWFEYSKHHEEACPYEYLCRLAKYAISSLRFLHKKGYVHRDLKQQNFAFGWVDLKNDTPPVDMPLKAPLYLLDFGLATKYKYTNGTHKPRGKISKFVGTIDYSCRTAILKFSQSRRDDMESLLFTLAIAAASHHVFFVIPNDHVMVTQRTKFVKEHAEISRTFKQFRVSDERVHNAFKSYATELNKLFISDEPEYYEKEPDYDAFCVCFGGKKGDKACAVE